jgi:hypothetical protein
LIKFAGGGAQTEEVVHKGGSTSDEEGERASLKSNKELVACDIVLAGDKTVP